jgi:hypothetical protein
MEEQQQQPEFRRLTRDAWLHVMGKVYQTLPLYENLKTTGVYVYRKKLRHSRQDHRGQRRVAGAQ